jgi:CubicO group peptidase (beta-lactamase class C family)
MHGDLLDAIVAGWPVDQAAAGVADASATLETAGDVNWAPRIASISKVMVGYAALVAVEEGTISLDEPAGREGATVRHLLAHAAGYDFDTPRLIADVATRRIYSNTGIEVFADHLAMAAGMDVSTYLHDGVFAPLGMGSSMLTGSPAHGVHSSVADLLVFTRELLSPSLVSASLLAEATSVQFPDLAGVLPGIGRYDPNPWGLGVEIKGDKSPHWSGRRTSPRTFGHFGGSGTFLWVDPEIGLGCVALADREFGPWALEAWPAMSDAVIERHRP